MIDTVSAEAGELIKISPLKIDRGIADCPMMFMPPLIFSVQSLLINRVRKEL